MGYFMARFPRRVPRQVGKSLVVDLGPGIPPVRRIAAALARRFNQICVTLSADSVADADLTPLQFAVLAYLNKRDGQPGIDQNALAARLGIERSHVSLLVEELGKRGLVERRVNSADRRARILRLTANGESAFDRLRKKNGLANDRVLDPLTAKERELLDFSQKRSSSGKQEKQSQNIHTSINGKNTSKNENCAECSRL